MNKPQVAIISLGCSKNLVDSERLAKLFETAGFNVAFGLDELPGDPQYIVVNTCGFIGDAKEESIETTLEAIALKNEGRVQQVYLMGCLGERYRNELTKEMPELDGIYGKFDWESIITAIGNKKKTEQETKKWERRISTLPHYTYLKIAEGCNRFCAFCAIPLITGRFKSRTPEDILEETKFLASKGVCEFNVIAQDLSSYGCDLDEQPKNGQSPLAALIEQMAQIKGVEMIRLHYAYPADFPMDVLDVMNKYPNVCRYLDIALQHIDDKVLSNMRRNINGESTRKLLKAIREKVPGIHIRTTLMVGFPGEDEEAFGRLLDFVKEQRFERMGAFAYCEEDDTYAAKHFADTIPQEIKQQRLDRLMSLQHEIAFEIAAEKIGKTMKVIVDSEQYPLYVCRSEFDSPEVDCLVYVSSEEDLRIGGVYDVMITDCEAFDLTGKLVK